MSASNAPYLTGSSLLPYLREIFPNRQVITSTEFRDFLNISPSTDQRMRARGKYPRTISLPGVMRDPRILLVDLAAWIEQGGCPETEGVTYKKRGRGSDEWKKNHPAKAKPAPETSIETPEPSSETASEAVPGYSPDSSPDSASAPSTEASSDPAAALRAQG